jgi:cephalosporin hydroxylase
MRFMIDTNTREFVIEENGQSRTVDLYAKEAYEIIARLWMKTSWNQKYPYTFTWLGRPIIQHPEDMIRTQEVIFNLKPTVIIETGVAHGGSLVYSASLLHLLGGKRVIGIDIDIRQPNRDAIEKHPLADYITLIEGDSTDPGVLEAVTRQITPNDCVLIILDSNHSYAHVSKELETYCHLVTPGSYIVATDGLMQDLHDVPRGDPTWTKDNPAAAARDFVARNPEFELRQPLWLFNESELRDNLTGWPDAWLYRRPTS